jgi:hypothetical protein
MKTFGSRCIDPHILMLALLGGEWSASRTGSFTPRERGPDTLWIGGCVGLRAGLDDVEKRKFLTLLGLKFRPHPVVQPIANRYTDCAILSLIILSRV